MLLIVDFCDLEKLNDTTDRFNTVKGFCILVVLLHTTFSQVIRQRQLIKNHLQVRKSDFYK